jgi:hypothetical protein
VNYWGTKFKMILGGSEQLEAARHVLALPALTLSLISRSNPSLFERRR